MSLQILKIIKLTKHAMLFACISCVCVVNAGPLNISNVPLELTPAVPPNIFILTDDSGSMDWEVLTQNIDNSGAFCSPSVDGSCNTAGITHRVPEGGVPASCQPYVDPATSTPSDDYVSGYLYAVRFPNDTFFPTDGSLADDTVIENCYVADDNAFRFRNSKFNPLYFDPNKTYMPWAGVDFNGMPYIDADITNAPDNPYNPQHFINLTNQNAGLDVSGNRISGAGFKYYDWNDANSNGIFDDGEQTENLISAQDAVTQQNFANWFTYYRKREYVAKALTSHAVADSSFSRVGYATTNQNTGLGLGVTLQNLSFSTGNKRTLLDELFSSNSSGDTNLRDAYEKVGKYFNCVSGDIFNSAGTSSPGSANCPALAAPGGECQANSTFFVTDGFDRNTTFTIDDEDTGGANNTNFDGGAFADNRANTLADVAMRYYEMDLQGSLADNVSVTSVDFSRDPNSPAFLQVGDSLHQHLNSNVLAIFNNINSSIDTSFPLDATGTETWTDPNSSPTTFLGKIDDLRHAAYNGRGNLITTFDGKDFPSVLGELESAFARASANSGSTTAMAFNTQSITQDTLVFRTFSDLSTNSGELAAQRVNPDGSFAVDLNGNPDFVWSAATALNTQSAASRLILTYEPVSQSGREFIITGSPASSGLTVAQQTDLGNPIPATPANPIVPTRVNYLRGDATNEGANFNNGDMRVRQFSTANGITTGGKLGDIAHSAPVFVGEPPFANRSSSAYPSAAGKTYLEFRTANTNRDELVYVGANDGMLHAFFADPLSLSKGQEKFAYIPNILLSEIGEFTNPNYNHRFYVDSSPSVNDVFIDPNPPTVNSFEWRTILVSGLGAGGKGYFALDITNPSSINTDSVLWEFTDTDDADLGFTYSQPVIGMSNIDDGVSGEKKWVAIFGNGYNSTSTLGEAAIYILFIDEGYDGWTDPGDFIKINTGNGIASSVNATPNGIGGVTGTDTDGNGTVDRVYAGDLQGNVYVIDISDPNTSNWNIASTLFTAKYQSSSPVPQPITTKPTVIANPSIANSYIVMVGTGSYFTTDDAINTDIQSIYGLLDSPSNSSPITKFSSPSQVVEQSLSTFVDSNSGLVIRTITDNPVVYKDTGSNQVRGWYIDFDIPPPGGSAPDVQFPGERPVRNLQLRNDQLFFSTVIPHDGMSCAPPSGGFGLSVNPITGGVTNVIFDINFDGLFNADDNLNLVDSPDHIIVGTQFESAPGDTTFIGNYRVTQLSNTNIDRILINPNLNTGGATGALLGRHSWKEIRQ